jgi:hypothetical protein
MCVALKWIADIDRGAFNATALMPFRQGHLPAVPAFIDHLTHEADVERVWPLTQIPPLNIPRPGICLDRVLPWTGLA